jgi:hypothetical protein
MFLRGAIFIETSNFYTMKEQEIAGEFFLLMSQEKSRHSEQRISVSVFCGM